MLNKKVSFHGFIIQSKCHRGEPITTLYVREYVLIPAIGTRARNSEHSIIFVIDGAVTLTFSGVINVPIDVSGHARYM